MTLSMRVLICPTSTAKDLCEQAKHNRALSKNSAFLCGPPIYFTYLENYIGAGTMEQ
jgi:hypothetical protein